MLFAGETLTLRMDLDFNQFLVRGETHLAFMFRILDNKNFILGSGIKDNLIVFINLV
jgi:hypothetical protein